MAESNENPDQTIENLEQDLEVASKKWNQVFATVIFILVVGGIILSILSGGISKVHLFDKPLSNTIKINLISSSDTNLVIRTDKGEIKLLNSNTQKVQDISLGDTQASHAALSPDGQLVAYVSTNSEGSALNLVSQEGKVTSIFDAETLNKAAKPVFSNDNKTKICEWSNNIYWSLEKTEIKSANQLNTPVKPAQNLSATPSNSTALPKNESLEVPETSQEKKLAFFACNDAQSVLFLVTTTENSPKIKPLWRTRADSIDPRQAVWLADGKIAFTSGDAVETLLLLDPNADEEPTHLYGSLNNTDTNSK